MDMGRGMQIIHLAAASIACVKGSPHQLGGLVARWLGGLGDSRIIMRKTSLLIRWWRRNSKAAGLLVQIALATYKYQAAS